jgi:hypothetical protein
VYKRQVYKRQIVNTAGVVTIEALSTNVAFSVAKATASKINVYIEAEVVNVQNLSGGAVDIAVKAIG